MIATKGTDRIVSDLVDILKMIGPILQFYQCESLYKKQTSRDSKPFLSATWGFPTLLEL